MPCKKSYIYSATVLNVLYCYLICFSVCVFLSSCANQTPRVNDVPLSVNCDAFCYPNTRQDRTAIEMQAIDGSLYIYMSGSYEEEDSIYRFDQNGVSKLENILISERYKPLWSDNFVGFGNGYMYIERHPAKDVEFTYPKMAELIYYDLATGVSETLIRTEHAAYMDAIFDENGYLCVSIKEMSADTKKQYHIIKKNELLPDMVMEPDARTGTVLEVLQKYNNIVPMLSESHLNNAVISVTELGIEKCECVLYPCGDGWLLHMSDSSVPLCLVSFDGTVSSVFEFECLTSTSSFNIYGDHAFFSLIRYEKWDDRMSYYLQPYENDSISGTYRINLTDLTITKISDNDYCGIFVFDDTGIFVCDKKEGVYHLDFNGNLIATLINPRD